MYVLQCFTKGYAHWGDAVRVDSPVLPRPGDTIYPWNDKPIDTPFIVFDVSHYVRQGEATAVVSAVAGGFKTRRIRLSENGYIDEVVGGEDYRYDELHLYPGDEWLDK